MLIVRFFLFLVLSSYILHQPSDILHQPSYFLLLPSYFSPQNKSSIRILKKSSSGTPSVPITKARLGLNF